MVRITKTTSLQAIQGIELLVILALMRIAMNPKEKWQELIILGMTAVLMNAIGHM